MSKFRLLSILSCSFLALTFILTTTSQVYSKDAEFNLKCGIMVSKDYAFSKGANFFAKRIAEETNGRVKVDVYTDGVLGSESEMWEGAKVGTLDMFVTSPGNVGTFIPAYQFFDLSYLFASKAHRDKVAGGPIGEKMSKMLEDKGGMIVLGQFGGSARNLILTKRKVEKLEDIKNMKMRVWPAPIVVKTWEALGTIPVVVAYAEAYSALQTGVVEGAENETSTFITQKWYEPAKYITMTEHSITVRPLLIGKKQFNKLPKDIQEAMMRVGKEAAEYAVKVEREDDAGYMKKLKDFGIEILQLKDKEKWIEATASIREDFAKQHGLTDILKEVTAAAE